MANPTQILRVRLALNISATEAEAALDELSSEEHARLASLLDSWDAVALRAADLESDGVIYSADKARQLVLNQISILLNQGGIWGSIAAASAADDVSTVTNSFGVV